jgi:hypothetical protein
MAIMLNAADGSWQAGAYLLGTTGLLASVEQAFQQAIVAACLAIGSGESTPPGLNAPSRRLGSETFPAPSSGDSDIIGQHYLKQIKIITTFQQLDAMGELQHDWNGYGAIPIDRAIIASASRFIENFGEQFCGSPRIVPMTKGRLQFEWHRGNRSLEMEFEDPDNIHYLKWDSDDAFEEEGIVPISDPDVINTVLAWFSSEKRNADPAGCRTAGS